MDWIEGLAAELDLEPLSTHETQHLLTSARDVAHRVERKLTPLAMYLVGAAVGRRMAEGATRDDALEDVIHMLLLRLPPEAEGEAPAGPPRG